MLTFMPPMLTLSTPVAPARTWAAVRLEEVTKKVEKMPAPKMTPRIFQAPPQ